MADEETETPFETKTVSVEYTVWGEYHYFASFCYSFGYRATRDMGETLTLKRIWFDGELVYNSDAGGKVKKNTSWYFRQGTSVQEPVPGAELAYREHIYLWFSNVDLGSNGSLPAVSIEVWEDGNLSVKDAVELLAVRAGYAAENIDVDDALAEVSLLGYILDGTASFESVLTDLSFFYDFAYTEDGETVTVSYDYDEGEFVVDLVIPVDGLAVLSENSQDQKYDTIEVGSDQSLPRTITASYFAADDDYNTGQQTAFRDKSTSAATSDVSLSLPIVAYGTEVRARLFDALARVWHEKNSHSLRLMPAYSRVVPGTTIQWESYGNQYSGVITKVTYNVDWSASVAVLERDAEYSATVVDTQGPSTPSDAVTGFAIRAVVIDCPDWDADQTEDDYLNYRVAIGSAGTRDEWLGAHFDITKADDLGNFQVALLLGPDEQIGIADLVSIGTTLKVAPRNMDPARWTDDDKLLIVGKPGSWELMTYTGVAEEGANIVLGGLDRGLFGTDDFMDKRAAGDYVIFANDTRTLRYSVQQFRDYIELSWRAVATFQPFDDADVSLYRPQGNSRKPYSPDAVSARRETNGDITIKWVRDDRFDGEPDDMYSVDIFTADWSRLIRRITNIEGQQVTYNVAAQTVDDTTLIESVNVTVFQVNASHVGRGLAGGGLLVLGEAGILNGRVGPLAGPYGNLRVWQKWFGVLGFTRGPRANVDFGLTLVELDGRVGPLRGPRGSLRGDEYYGRVGPLAGPSGELFTPEYPILRYRSSGFKVGTAISPGDMMEDDPGLADAISYGDVLIVHDVRYGTPSHIMGMRDGADERWILLGELDKRSTSGLWQAVWAFVIDNPSALPTISAADTTFTNPLTWCMTQVTVWSNVDNEDPVDAFGMNFSNTNSTSHPAPSITTTEDNDALLTLVGTRMNSSPATYTGPSGQTDLGGANSVNDSAYPGEYAGGDLGALIDAAYSIKETAGATGTKSFGYSGSFPYVSASVALKYAPQPDSPSLPIEYVYGDVTEIDSTALSLAIPDGRVGDLLYAYLFRSGNTGTASTPAGWTLRSNVNVTVDRQQVFSTVADGSEGSTLNISYNNSGDTKGFIVRVSNHSGEDANTEYVGDNNSFTVAIPPISPDLDHELILAFAGWGTGEPTFGPSGFILEVDDGGTPGVASAAQLQGDKASTGTVNFIADSAQHRAGWMVAIKPSFEPPGAYLFGRVGPLAGPHGGIAEYWAANATVAMGGFGATANVTVTSGPSPHRYWRVYMTAPQAGQTVVGFKNWELRLTSGGADQTAPGGAVSASSFTSGFPASNLVDADTESIWASASGGSPWWIKYDFGAGNEKAITACFLVAYASNRGPSAFTIDYSDDDSSWTTVYTGSGVTWGGGFSNLFTW